MCTQLKRSGEFFKDVYKRQVNELFIINLVAHSSKRVLRDLKFVEDFKKDLYKNYIIRDQDSTFSGSSPLNVMAKRWIVEFKMGRTSTTDEPRSGGSLKCLC